MAIAIEIEGYDSFEQIAVGGMAAVYKARKISIDKIVAIKVLFPYLASDDSFIDRFQREAKSAAKVQHENIVNVVDFGESGGSYYIVMEFYEGVTIADLIKQQTSVPLDVAMAIILDVCLGLEAAHAQDIVHRDIKPANIIYTTQGGIKIADFGLAKKSDTMTVVTLPGKVVGTPAYMSPEQAAADNVGPQSDIFSLGVVAYELLSNKRPFEGSSYSEVIEKIQTQPVPSITSENPLIQSEIQQIIEKMLEKDVSRRYQDVSEVISDVERTMEHQGISRDRRRLGNYLSDPAAYAEKYKTKTVAKCLSQGSFYMQKGKTHLEDALWEFKKILYLDPTNERARKYLAKIMSEHNAEHATLTLDKISRPDTPPPSQPKPDQAGAAAPASSKTPGKQPARKRRAPRHLVPAMLVIVAIGMIGGWWSWKTLRVSEANVRPVLSAPSRLTVSEGESVEFSLTVVGDDENSSRIYGEELPDGAELTEAGSFRWNVNFDQAGKHDLRFFADNGQSVTAANTVVEVVDTEVALDFEPIAASKINVGKTLDIVLEASGESGKPVEFTLRDAPDGMSIRDGKVSWRPSKKQTGTFRVPVTATDGLGKTTQTLVVEVAQPPVQKPAIKVSEPGRLDWILPKLANIYVDGELKVREDTFLSIPLAEGRHLIRAELLDGMTVFEETVNIRSGSRVTLDPPRIEYGRLSVYFLGGVGEFYVNGSKFKEQPPFTEVVLPTGNYTVECRMFRDDDSRKFDVSIKEGLVSVVEYEIGSQPNITYESPNN